LEALGLILKRRAEKRNEYEVLTIGESDSPSAPNSSVGAGNSPPPVQDAHGNGAGEAPKEYSENNNQLSYNQSVIEDAELGEILENCELENLRDEKERELFRAAVEHMYLAESIDVCGANYPQSVVRKNLRRLNYGAVAFAHDALRARDAPPKAPLNYLISTLYHAIFEAG
jgi:hypothetical protein